MILQEYHVPGPVGRLDPPDYLCCFAIWEGEIRVLVIDNALIGAGDTVVVREPFFRLVVGFFCSPHCWAYELA